MSLNLISGLRTRCSKCSRNGQRRQWPNTSSHRSIADIGTDCWRQVTSCH
uniref:Uncharacterized protein n=1 Tax=Arundo donax TaxID=35708 RepID=A0A0A9E1L4_ARUDO